MNNWICPYCQVEMLASGHSSGLCNGWSCPTCKHETVESGSYSLSGRPPITLCRCVNCEKKRKLMRIKYKKNNMTLKKKIKSSIKTFNKITKMAARKEYYDNALFLSGAVFGLETLLSELDESDLNMKLTGRTVKEE